MKITKCGYIDTLDYSKERTPEEKETFLAVYNLYYNSPSASEEEILSTISLIEKYHGIKLERV